MGVVFSSISHSFFILFGFLFVLRQGIWWLSYYLMGFPDDSVVKNPLANAEDMGSSPGSEDPLEKEMATHPSIFA